jgi:predicted ATPase
MVPLAIELAAARSGALRPVQIAGLLDERFRLLTGGRAGAAGRQQTLQATLEWSYALLSGAEQRLFDVLGCSWPVSVLMRPSRWPPQSAWTGGASWTA